MALLIAALPRLCHFLQSRQQAAPGRRHIGVAAMAAARKEAPGGAWASPISSELIVSQSIGLGAPTVAPDGRMFWLEGRPTEGGRQVLVSRCGRFVNWQ